MASSATSLFPASVVMATERVVRRAVTLICAGWLPQDGLFGGSCAAGLEGERGHGSGAAHRAFAGRSSALLSPSLAVPEASARVGYSSKTASDQHQPASSRADRGVGNDGLLGPCVKPLPAGVESLVTGVTALPCRRAGQVPAASDPSTGGLVAGAVFPGRLDQQSAGVAVAGLGDPALTS